jgi:hypothetical protein
MQDITHAAQERAPGGPLGASSLAPIFARADVENPSPFHLRLLSL